MKFKKVYILVVFMLLAIPLGLMTDYPAWGEWDLDYFYKSLGFVPEGMKNSIEIPAIMPDYSLDNVNPIVSYYVSAIIGLAFIFGFFYFLKHLEKDER